MSNLRFIGVAALVVASLALSACQTTGSQAPLPPFPTHSTQGFFHPSEFSPLVLQDLTAARPPGSLVRRTEFQANGHSAHNSTGQVQGLRRLTSVEARNVAGRTQYYLVLHLDYEAAGPLPFQLQYGTGRTPQVIPVAYEFASIVGAVDAPDVAAALGKPPAQQIGHLLYFELNESQRDYVLGGTNVPSGLTLEVPGRFEFYMTLSRFRSQL